MTLEQLYEQCCALQPNAQMAFAKQHSLDWGEFWCYMKAHKPQRSRKKQRQSVLAEQGGNCALCETAIGYHDSLRLDRQTGKVFCPGCQLSIAQLRKLVTIGVTLDRLLPFVPGLTDTAPVPPTSPPAPAPPAQPAPLTFDTFAQAWRKRIE